jgi:hypothetical protein
MVAVVAVGRLDPQAVWLSAASGLLGSREYSLPIDLLNMRKA